MSAIFSVLILALSYFSTSLALHCFNIEKFPETKFTNAAPDCEGNFCAIWKNRQGRQTQDCLSGHPFKKLPMGCRINRQGALLCICNSGDRCNTEDFLKSAPVNLPVVRCRNFVEAAYLAKESVDTTCEGNACFYERTQNLNLFGQKILQNRADCSVFPDQVFDIQIAFRWPGPGVTSGYCYQMQYSDVHISTGCMCKETDCNKELPYSIPSIDAQGVVCHLAYNKLREDTLDKETCRGQFCFVQRAITVQNEVRFTKGCLTVSGTGGMVTGYRNILGTTEQWICNTELCNKNVDIAQKEIQRAPTDASGKVQGSSLVFITLFLFMVYSW